VGSSFVVDSSTLLAVIFHQPKKNVLQDIIAATGRQAH
jgi:hypothetical protein